LHPERLLAQAAGAVAKDVIERFGDNDGFDEVDGGGHSMGGPAQASAAEVKPERFRTAVLIAPAGVDGHNLNTMRERLPDVIRSETKALRDGETEMQRLRAAKAAIYYASRNPLRTVLEGIAVASNDMKPIVTSARQKGVLVGGLFFWGDRFFPVWGVSDVCEGTDLFDEFRVHPNKDATHAWPQKRAADVVFEVLSMINSLTQPVVELSPVVTTV